MYSFDDLRATADRLNALEPSAEKWDGAVRAMHEAYADQQARRISAEQRDQIMAVLNHAIELQQYLDTFPFSLACTSCDRGAPDTYAEAIAEGWTDIQFDGTGLSWNYLGACPCCREEEAKRGGTET
jgi:hypothetical protein